MEVDMRSLFALSALLIVASTGPTMARDYPWCARTDSNGFNGDCSFTSYQQCMATVSGQRGECAVNPRLSFDQARPRNRGRANRDWQDNGWQGGNGWNNRW
jgi:Protein of unknown function (DUF3551)